MDVIDKITNGNELTPAYCKVKIKLINDLKTRLEMADDNGNSN